MILPVLAQNEVGGIHAHLAQQERIGDLPQEKSLGFLDRLPAVGRLGSRLDQLVDLLEAPT